MNVPIDNVIIVFVWNVSLHFRSSGRPAAWGRQRRSLDRRDLARMSRILDPRAIRLTFFSILYTQLHLVGNRNIHIDRGIRAPRLPSPCHLPAGLGQLPASASQSPIPLIANTITNTTPLLQTQWPRSGHTLSNTLRAPQDMSEAAKCTRYPSSLLVSSLPATSLLAGISSLACTSLPSLPGTTAL
jgi:hypothetical protein